MSKQDTVIYKVKAVDGDKGVSKPNNLRYEIFSGSYENITLNNFTGDLIVSGLLDRENSDLIKRFGSINMKIRATEINDDEYVSESTLQIKVTDVNDNKPSFNSDYYYGRIFENSQIDTIVVIDPPIIVSDPDEGRNGTMNVTILSNIFTLSPSSNNLKNEASLFLRVFNETALNYEHIKNYSLQIIVQETETIEKFSSSATVFIEVIDVNDNWPIFHIPDPLIVSIPENSPKDTFVARINATDLDSGNFGRIFYYIRGPKSKKFEINNKTGVITVAVDAHLDNTLLNRETESKIFLIVDAVDGGGFRSSLSVEVHLSDINDNAPIFLKRNYEGYARENSEEFENEILLKAEDSDQSERLTFEIQSSKFSDLFYIRPLSPFTASIQIKLPIDFEKLDPLSMGNLSLTVIVKDSGNPSLSSKAPLNIIILDLNDEIPSFEQDLYETSLKENAKQNQLVLQINATDGDLSSPNNQIYYRIETGSKDQFVIDSSTGFIMVNVGSKLDKDITQMYEMIVIAVDRGIPTNTGTTTVQLRIEDVNNKDPIFFPTSQATEIYENATIGHEVFIAKAFDPDINSNLLYNIRSVMAVNSNNRIVTDIFFENPFEIEKVSGIISTIRELDREKIQKYLLIVFVSDLNAFEPNLQNATLELIVELKDVNDNAPSFERQVYFANSLKEDAKLNTPVITVHADDKDDPTSNNAKVHYQIDLVNTNASGYFDIEEKTGSVFVVESLVNYTGMRYLTILAVDGGTPKMSNSTIVMVFVEDINDRSPLIISPEVNKTLFVAEGLKKGTHIEKFTAIDGDKGPNGEIRYKILWTPDNDYSNKFMIDEKTGILMTSMVLDREEKKEYWLKIQAHDRSSDRKDDVRLHKLVVTDRDDNPPTFDRNRYKIPFPLVVKEESVNEVIGNLSLATDPDLNSSICYYVVGGTKPWRSHFSLAKETGILTVIKALDREKVNSIELVVKADQDCLTNPWQNVDKKFNITDRTELLVHVKIQDINDNPPVFTKYFFVVGVSKDSQFETEVLNLHSVSKDDDLNENANLTWFIISDFTYSPSLQKTFSKKVIPFIIFPYEGIIRTNTYFKPEWEGNIKFEVQVNDSNPNHLDKAKVSVNFYYT